MSDKSEIGRARLLRTMNACLVADVPAGNAYVEAARGWLTGVLAEVLPSLDEGLRTQRVVRAKPVGQMTRPWGEPGQVLARLIQADEHPMPLRQPLYSQQSWQRMLEALAGFPYTAGIQIWQLDESGDPMDDGTATIKVQRPQLAPEWVRFTFSAPSALTGWADSAAVQDDMADFVRREAARIGACAGSMTDDIGPGQETALARATLSTIASVRKSRAVLQGYSWVTVVAAELAARLGGKDKLAATGAFYDVSALPDGTLWLRATAMINDFIGEPVRKVFEELAPVLITGRTEFLFSEYFRLVEGVDAADYRQLRVPDSSPWPE